MINLYRKHLAIILIIIMSLVVLPMHAFAEETKPLELDCQLTIDYIYGENPVTEAEFHIFKVGEIYANNSASLIGKFAKYDVDINAAANDNLHSVGRTLYTNIVEDKIEPEYRFATDSNGRIRIASLEAGVYLVAGQSKVIGDDKYSTLPQIVFLPFNPSSDTVWNSNITIVSKAEVTSLIVPKEYNVKKIWNDTGAEKLRPESITVELYGNSEYFDSIELNKDKNWSHTWNDLDPKKEWNIKEIVPKGYKLESIVLDGNTFLITNSYTDPNPPTDEEIGQTGLLWWPVPVMAFVGISLVLLGVYISRKENYEK